MLKKSSLLLILVASTSLYASDQSQAVVRSMLNCASTQEGRVMVVYHKDGQEVGQNFWYSGYPVYENPQSMPQEFDTLHVLEPVMPGRAHAVYLDFASFPFVPHGMYTFEKVKAPGTYALKMGTDGAIKLIKDGVVIERSVAALLQVHHS